MKRLIDAARKLTVRRDNRRYVFVVTYGRSGSTLLMNLINSADGCCIRGENNNALYGLYQSYAALNDAVTSEAKSKNAHKPTSPWFGLSAINTGDYVDGLIETFTQEVLRPQAGDRVIGFKEIRHSAANMPDFQGYMTFLTTRFPQAKIVFNHRNLDDVSKSKWWANAPRGLDTLKDMEAKFNSFNDPSLHFHFSYDRALNDRAHVAELYEFLELGFDAQKIEQVFAMRHSY